MNINAELKRNGINVIDRLDTLSINSLSKNVAYKISKAFPKQNFNFQDLFIQISRIPMYIAEMPDGIAEAFYNTSNSSIYFKNGVPVEELEKSAVHEVIHYLQEIKDKKGKLKRLGLCDYTGNTPSGMALNEGAVQLAASKALNNNYEMVKYYDITFSTVSPTFYPILCNLVSQLAYIVSDNTLFYDSLFNGTTEFHKQLIYLCGEKNYFKIQDNLDRILYIEENIIKINSKLLETNCTDKQAARFGKLITKCKNELKKYFFDTQNIIFTSYFNNEIKKIITTTDIEEYRYKLYNYKNYLGITDGYTYFNDFYVNKMEQLEEKHEKIINNLALVPHKTSGLRTLLSSLRKVFSLNGQREFN